MEKRRRERGREGGREGGRRRGRELRKNEGEGGRRREEGREVFIFKKEQKKLFFIKSGLFINDKRQGLGKQKDSKGNIKIGLWENGKENGKFIQVKDGKSEKEEWKEGERVRVCDKDEGGFEDILKILEEK